MVSSLIHNAQVHRVPVDDGSSFNIITTKTLKQMQIPCSEVNPLSKSFFGIVPGAAHKPIGQIMLLVVFRQEDNYQMECCTFEVVNFKIPYNALLSQPQLAHFMGVASYTYIMLKIPGPNGVITVRDLIEYAVECDIQSFDLGARPPGRMSMMSNLAARISCGPKPT